MSSSSRVDLTMTDDSSDSKAASSAAAADSTGAARHPFALTRDQKKHYVDTGEALPLRALGCEFHLHAVSCSPAESGAKNCRHNVSCLHGLGWKKKGALWDESKGRAAIQALLGPNPHDRAIDEESHVGLRNLGAT